jgi:hypothetical protein
MYNFSNRPSQEPRGRTDKVHDDHEPVVIVRSGSKPAGVLMSLEDFASYQGQPIS